MPILCGKSREETVKDYNTMLESVHNHYVVGLFGMGLDSHTAGILPGSEAASEGNTYVMGYQGPDFDRITITPAYIESIDKAFLFAQGEQKRKVLEGILTDMNPVQYPVQYLKRAAGLSIF
jgi:6-phosphogluconolactonase/glucosamine-6-phosphate isomerase/deaminase